MAYRKTTKYLISGLIGFHGQQFAVPEGLATEAQCAAAWAEGLKAVTDARKKHTADPLPVTARDILTHGLTTFVSQGARVVNQYEIESSEGSGIWIPAHVVGKDDGTVEMVADADDPAALEADALAKAAADRQAEADAAAAMAKAAADALEAELAKLEDSPPPPAPVPVPVPVPGAVPETPTPEAPAAEEGQ